MQVIFYVAAAFLNVCGRLPSRVRKNINLQLSSVAFTLTVQ